MYVIKIKVADEPCVIVSALANPYKVNLKVAAQTYTGLIEDEMFVMEIPNIPKMLQIVEILSLNKISFIMEYSK